MQNAEEAKRKAMIMAKQIEQIEQQTERLRQQAAIEIAELEKQRELEKDAMAFLIGDGEPVVSGVKSLVCPERSSSLPSESH